jgi:hypothetical protein
MSFAAKPFYITIFSTLYIILTVAALTAVPKDRWLIIFLMAMMPVLFSLGFLLQWGEDYFSRSRRAGRAADRQAARRA